MIDYSMNVMALLQTYSTQHFVHNEITLQDKAL